MSRAQLFSSRQPVMVTVWMSSSVDTARRRVESMDDNAVIIDTGCDTGQHENMVRVAEPLRIRSRISTIRHKMPMRATTVRFSEDLRRLLEREAEREGVSAAQFIRDASVMRAAYAMGRRGDPAFEAAALAGNGGNGESSHGVLGAEEARRLTAARAEEETRAPCSPPPRRCRTPRASPRCAAPGCSTRRPTPASTVTSGSQRSSTPRSRSSR